MGLDLTLVYDLNFAGNDATIMQRKTNKHVSKMPVYFILVTYKKLPKCLKYSPTEGILRSLFLSVQDKCSNLYI